MNYLMLWKIKVLISFLILVEDCSCCQVITDRPIEKVLEENYNSPWLVFIIDVTLGAAQTQGIKGLAYGSLIHRRLVLTAGYPLTKSKIENLEVRANCTAKNKKIICVTQKVSLKLDSSAIKKKVQSIEDWVVLLLEKSFVMSERINVINLAYSSDTYDKTCQIYHWQIVAVYDYTKVMMLKSTGVLHDPYNVTLNGDEFEITKKGLARMTGDRDCLIEDCYDYDDELKTLIKKISFVGSPIVCQLEDGTPVQVGFATAIYELLNDETKPDTRIRSGGLVRLLNDTDKYMKSVVKSKYL
ncbi:uncharacterized protein LOC123264434 isoform X1 [Cotesia glomerata]|uniref:uncharacterized protein LOC123264434 isoform X1 n=1 Tax=Cotesia glomerata TaxID=32391 RepID=UPI001D014ADE|nr:uncharacterized protein LOC123264434 isoform X1 [Cotesia glomerata]